MQHVLDKTDHGLIQFKNKQRRVKPEFLHMRRQGRRSASAKLISVYCFRYLDYFLNPNFQFSSHFQQLRSPVRVCAGPGRTGFLVSRLEWYASKQLLNLCLALCTTQWKPLFYTMCILTGTTYIWTNIIRAATSENRSSGFPTRSDTNRAVQPQKMARDL